MDAMIAGYGPPDVLVLNAGGPAPGRILDVADDAWRAGTRTEGSLWALVGRNKAPDSRPRASAVLVLVPACDVCHELQDGQAALQQP
jgi:hypothetical protein